MHRRCIPVAVSRRGSRRWRGCLVAELDVHSRLDRAVEVSEATLTLIPVAVPATNHCISQGIDVGSSGLRGRRVAGELFVDSLLEGGVVGPEATLAFIAVAVVAANHCIEAS